MATKDRKKLQHIHSSIADKQPTPQSLEVGEIAVNNSAGKEFLSLKNSNDKVVRFSSDSTLIDWIENKEVVPYKGYVRGAEGPSATSGDSPTSTDGHGSYGITNDDLLNNKSNLIFKINQVAAKKTIKYDKINAAKDLYNKDINPSENTPTGKTDGAGFFIDMSRYAMIGANPSFSSITVTDKSDLSGNTTIANGDSTGTRTGHTLAIKTTDVTANDTNWTETITNKESTVTNETDKITTLNESATTRTTVVGTENLTVSGTTTEVHTGDVTVTNSNNVIENTNGTTTIDRKGNVSENNQNNVTVVTSGTTTETKVDNVTETNLADKQESTSGNSYNDVKLAYSGTTGGTTTEVKVGDVTENHSGATTENKNGVVTENNLSSKTENTTGILTENNSSNHIVNTTGRTNITRTDVVTEDNKNNVVRTTSGTTTETFKDQVTENNQSGYTVNTTGDVIVNTTGATTETKVGNVTENHSGTTTENYSGKWSVNVTSGTEITSCSSTTINTNNFKLTQCDGTSGTAEFDFCGGYKINTDKMEILQCSENGAMDVKEKEITVSGTSLELTGTSLTIRESGATDFSGNTLTVTTASDANINVKGNLVEAVTGTTNETHSGAVTINNGAAKTENTTGEHSIYSTGNTCINSQANANFYGKGSTNIGVACDGTTKGSATTVVGTTTLNMSGATTTISGNTTNVTGATTLNLSGNTTNKRALTANTTSTSAYTSATTATTVIGTANTSATTATLSGDTLVVNEATSISAKTPTAYVSGTTLDINETNTDITSCGRISANTNDFEVKQCAANGKTIINSDDIDISGKTFDVVETTSTAIKAPATTISGTSLTIDEGTSISAKTPSTTISGTNFTLNETNTTINSCGKVEITTDSYSLKQCSSSGGSAEFEFCNGYTVKSNAINLQQCGTAGTINITSQTQNINGGNLTVNESGNTVINTVGNTNVETNGANNKVTIQASGSGGDVEVFAKDTLNETGGTVNITSTNNTNISAKDFCVKGSTSASIGAPTTNIGKACDNSTATTINISGTTINEGGTTNNNNFATINNTATTINNKANFNITGTTYISGNTTISGDVTIGDELIIPIPCDSITSTTVNNALCEILNRGAVTIEKNTSPTDPQLATIYTIKQNGAVINTIEVAKDQFLQNAEVVKNTSGEWVIRLTWWIYDPDSGTHTTATTDVAASELVKDLTAVNPSDNGTALNHNVKVSSWYDSTSGDMKFSAETTQNMNVGNMYVTGTTSASTVSGTNVNGGTISGTTVKGVSISGTNITASAAIRADNVSANTISAATGVRANNVSANTISATTFYGKMSKSLTWAAGAFTADTTGYNGSADKVITVPTNLSHIGGNKKLTIDYGDVYGKTDTSYIPSADTTVVIPDSLANVSHQMVVDSTPANTGGTITIKKPINVSGTVTASGAIYSSDRNLKDNIVDIDDNELDKAASVSFKSYNFKGESNKIYGVIAQDLQEIGLNEMVYTKDDGTLAVDYTSLMILEIAKLRRDENSLLEHIAWLERRIEKLESEKKD